MNANERSLPNPGDVPKWVYHEVLDALEEEQLQELEDERAEEEDSDEGDEEGLEAGENLLFGGVPLKKAQGQGMGSKAVSTNYIRQVFSLWTPVLVGLTAAAVLAFLGIPDLTTEDLRRVASLCASLLIAGLASLGIVAAFGIRTGSVKEPNGGKSGENDPVSVENYLVAAGLGLLASALLTCAAILVGGLSEAGWLANFICISGLVAAVLQIFSEPIALIVARKTREPFLLDGISS